MWLVVNFAKDPTEFIQVGLIGLTNGLIFGLVALGYTLVYGILQLINFAHGDVFALSGLVASTMIVSVLGLDANTSVPVIIGGMLLTLVAMMIMFAVVNASIEFVAYRRLRSAPRLAALITAVGMSFIIQNISLAIYGVNYHSVPNFIPRSEAFEIAGISYSWNKLAVVLITLPVLALLSWFVTLDEAGQGDARRRPGHRGLGDDGHQREPDDLGHVRDRRRAGRRRRRSSTCSSSTCATTRASSSA